MKVSGIHFVQGKNAYSDVDGKKYGIAVHNTANNASAVAEASYATRRTDGVSAQFYADRTTVIQSLDTNTRAGHAGSSIGNDNAIAFEFTGTNDKSRQWWLENVNWSLVGRVTADVCRYHNIEVRRASVAEMKTNPKVRAFYSHDDMRRAWGGTTHTDPGPNFPWDVLFANVNTHLNPPPPVQEDEEDMPTSQSYSIPPGAAYNADGGLLDRSKALALGLPAGERSGAGFGWIYLSLVADPVGYPGDPVKVRVAIHDGNNSNAWNVSVIAVPGGKRVSIPMPAPAGDSAYGVSVGRLATPDGEGDDVPLALMVEMTKRA